MNYDELENPNTGGDEVTTEKTSEDVNQKLPPGSDPNNLNQPIYEDVPGTVDSDLKVRVPQSGESVLVPQTPTETPRDPDWSVPIAKEDEHEHLPVVRAEAIAEENNKTENETQVPVNEAGENDN